MKLLLDSCIWAGAKAALKSAGHEVEWVGDWAADPGDDTVLAHAAQNGQVIVTLDKDFGELAIVFDAAHAGILDPPIRAFGGKLFQGNDTLFVVPAKPALECFSRGAGTDTAFCLARCIP